MERLQVNTYERGHDKGKLFSLDPEDYAPRCRSCHNRYDGIGAWLHAVGENHRMAKLTEVEAKQIIDLGWAGYSGSEIACLFKISIEEACNIVSGRTWKYLARGDVSALAKVRADKLSIVAKKRWAKMGSEQRAEIARKGHATRLATRNEPRLADIEERGR